MRNINQVVRSISGHNDRRCYDVLRLAVHVVSESMPERLLMKEIARRTSQRAIRPMTEKAVARALERAAADVWVHGCRSNLELIYNRPLLEAPSAKSLVFALAEYCQEPSGPVCAPPKQQLEAFLRLLNTQIYSRSEP